MNRFVFYPVGQGLFYAGQLGCRPFAPFYRNFIFDCGGEEPYIGDAVARFVKETAYDNIFLCVISHLHKDHYNGLALLKNKGVSIDKIVLPYLPHKYTALKFVYIVGQYFSDSQNLTVNEDDLTNIRLMSKFYHIQELSDDDRSFCRNVIDFEERKIQNGFNYFRFVKTFGYYDENFVVELYNKAITDEKWEEFNQKLSDYLEKEGIVNIFELFPNKIEDLVKIYKVVFAKNLNITSIVMKHYFQGRTFGYYPVQDSRFMLSDGYRFFNCPHVFERLNKNVTVLTGDAEFDKILQQRIFEDEPSISVLQVPHHGALTNWNKMKLPRNVECKLVIPYGLGNKYNHPNCEVVKDILKMQNCELISVTQSTQYEYLIKTI